MKDIFKKMTPMYDYKTVEDWSGYQPPTKFFCFYEPTLSEDGSLTESCFSSWWKCPFTDGEVNYTSLEQFIMVHKAEYFNDEESKALILKEEDPKKIHELGRKIKHFSELLWDEVKYSVVFHGNLLKFRQNEDLKIFLLKTMWHSVLVEASLDKVWGVGLPIEEAGDFRKWKGQNLLGFNLMEARHSLEDDLVLRIKDLDEIEKKGYQDIFYLAKEIHFEDSIKTLKNLKIKNASCVKRIYLPDEIEVIPESCFENTYELDYIKLPKKLKRIGKRAFRSSGVDEIILPEGLISIGDWAFANCRDMKKLHLPSTLESIGKEAFDFCIELEEMNELPSSLMKLKDRAFSRCELIKKVNLPKSLKFIGKNVFNSCYALKELILEDGLEVLGKALLSECESIEDLLIPASLKKIRENAFRKSSVKKVILEEGIEEIGERAFWYCDDLREINFPESLKRIGEGAFLGCDLRGRYRLPEGLKSIGDYAFSGNKNLEGVVVKEGLEYLGEGAFMECEHLQEVVFRGELKSLPKRIFDACLYLHHIVLPKNLEKIEDFAFLDCQTLENLTLPESLTYLGNKVFHRCFRLPVLRFPKKLSFFGEGYFFLRGKESPMEDRTIEIPKESLYFKVEGDAVLSVDGKKLLRVMDNPMNSEFRLPSTVIEIEERAFEGCELKKVVLNHALTSLPSHCFSEMWLEEIVFPETSLTIKCQCFEACRGLRQISIPSSLQLEEAAFSKITDLEEVRMLEGHTSIPKECFMDCKSLKKISFPSTLEIIEDFAFRGCTEISDILLPESLRMIKEGAFCDSHIKETLHLGKNLETIENGTFGSAVEISLYEGTKVRNEKGESTSIFEIFKKTVQYRSFQLKVKSREDGKMIFSGFIPFSSLPKPLVERKNKRTTTAIFEIEGYDALFDEITNEAMKIYFALMRLEKAEGLTEERKEVYLRFLKNINIENPSTLSFLDRRYRKDGIKALKILFHQGILKPDYLNRLINEENEKGNTEAMLSLMQLKNDLNFFEKNEI